MYLADADIPLARGWYRQDDFPQNEVLYDDDLGPKAYLSWLRALGVRYVVLPHADLDYSARAEGALVAGGRTGLRPVFHTATLTIYEVPAPRSIITGPGSPTLTSLTQSHIGVVVHRVTPKALRGNVLWLDTGDEKFPKLRKKEDWNHLRISFKGPRLEVWLNETKVCDVTDDPIDPAEAPWKQAGPISFQWPPAGESGGFNGFIKFRNVRAREL